MSLDFAEKKEYKERKGKNMPDKTFWIIKKTEYRKFPYRLTISRGAEIFLDLLVQDRWPGSGRNIFCIRPDGSGETDEAETEIERVPVLNYSVFGKRLTVILDRATQKRCSFLFLTKGYKNREGEYEQIFWQTQQGLAQRKTKYKLAYCKTQETEVFVDSGERYAWNFPGAKTVKERLPIGDYAIKDKFGFLAIIERKTFSNMMGELGNLKKFHQHLCELGSCKNSALVVEANYGDFLNPKKIKPYFGNFGAKAIAEIQAVHPKLPVVFAGSRKMAAIWAQNFFNLAGAGNAEYLPKDLRDSSAKYGSEKTVSFSEDEARRTVFQNMPDCFTTKNLLENLPRLSNVRARIFLEKLKKEGVLQAEKNGRNIIWKKTGNGNFY